MMRDAKMPEIYEGTSEVMKMIIAGSVFVKSPYYTNRPGLGLRPASVRDRSDVARENTILNFSFNFSNPLRGLRSLWYDARVSRRRRMSGFATEHPDAAVSAKGGK